MYFNTFFRGLLCVKIQRAMTNDKFMRNLRDEIRKKLGEKNLSMVEFSILCDISYECLCAILYRKTKSVNSQTLINICENADISLVALFEIEDDGCFRKAASEVLPDGRSKKVQD